MDTPNSDQATSAMDDLAAQQMDIARAQAANNAANPGSGQTGGGTAPSLPSDAAPATAVPLATDELHTIANQNPVDHAMVITQSLAATGADLAGAVEAALEANQSPAPSGPIEQQLAAVHTRLGAVENVISQLAPLATAIIPDVEPITSRITAAETTLAYLENFAKSAAPLLERIEAAFNKHFQGKV